MMAGAALAPVDVAAVLIVLAAVMAYVNHRFIGLPSAVGLTLMGAMASIALVTVDRLFPASGVSRIASAFVAGIDFHEALMNGMLSFLLFAGALHVDWRDMQRGRWAIIVLSTFGVMLSTAIVGVGFWLGAGWLGYGQPLIWCLVFGALISPTDPVSVLDVLKRTDVPPTLRATVAAESLFNDGVGVVVFVILIGMALSGAPVSPLGAAWLFAIQAGGGVALGLALGWLAVRAMASIDDYKVEVLITLAVVMGGYTLARPLQVSGPVAMAVAGLVIGNAGTAAAMSATTRDYLHKFWSLVDDILNAVLFLLIGLEILTVPREAGLIAVGALAIALALGARAISVLLPLSALSRGRHDAIAPVTLIWGGLRGGISVALALGLPPGNERGVILAATYAVVLFAVVVQGGTISRVIGRACRRGEAGPRAQI